MLEAFGDLKSRRYLIEYTLRYVLVVWVLLPQAVRVVRVVVKG